MENVYHSHENVLPDTKRQNVAKKHICMQNKLHAKQFSHFPMQLILNAAISKRHDAIPLVVVDCDNNGVVSHGNEPLRPFPTNQSQADIFCIFKNLIYAQPFHV
jgi:hypothetical protein